MKLTPTIRSVRDLMRKLERESYRVLHARNGLHRADHFMNFCITADSMQDHLLEYLNQVASGTDKVLRDRWHQEPVILATADIANSTKHFVLRHPRSKKPRVTPTKSVKRGSSEVVDIYEDKQGALHYQFVSIPDYYVRLSDGARFDLHSFIEKVLAFWRSELARYGQHTRRQSFRRLSGYPDDAKPIDRKIV